MQINLFVFDRFPQPLDKYVVAPAAFAVHAYLDSMRCQRVDERRAGELAALVGIHDLGHPVFADRASNPDQHGRQRLLARQRIRRAVVEID